jgi:ADP-L-glycero-D-manno-heptose 6-epimerase
MPGGKGALMYLVTGGAGFIGSNLVAALDDLGHAIAVNDTLGADDKWRNIAKRRLADFVPPDELMRWLEGRKLDAVIHLGANSDTTATDADAVIAVNFRLSLALLDWCTQTRTPFVYASSAATYGDGAAGFDDDGSVAALRRLAPLNLYGWSKHLFDLAVADRAARNSALPPQWAGLKFFNVFGPNEYHKAHMRSVVATVFEEAQAGRPVRLFKSYREEIGDGEQKRDFVYVDDAVNVMLWLLERPDVSGLFNVGSGHARSFRDLAEALFQALGRAPDIEYIEMPAHLRPRYQYFTQASLERLRSAGYDRQFTPLERSVAEYVTRFLAAPDRYR